MKFLVKRRREGAPRRLGIVEELEMLARRARVLVYAVPVMVLLGLGVGQLLNGALSIGEDAPARISTSEVSGAEVLALSGDMVRLREAGQHTAEYVRVYQEEVAPVEHVLRKRDIPFATARRVAWPLVEQSYRNGVDPAMVLSVVLVESAGRPEARSSVGARGLMQVMPFWSGYWRGCGRDLYEIEANLCNGTRILAWYLDRNRGDERRALLGYNGCVRGTNTPNCGVYPDKVDRLRRQVRTELASARRSVLRRSAAAEPAADSP